MVTTEERGLDQFVTRRMLRYCKESGLNYYEATKALHLSEAEKSVYEGEWVEA
ncbi:hypothetical protein [Phaeocystidibacter marisrubri]|uniref:hypothetical protein n=1 Tax=Phaeocystidibacter marisrubri TaxID=1577780 RepID=UPI00147854EE|nr:hypothetical protein [Phaeocystidibacter marisrubri]GGH68744.1 hypothetical protein GCM10011318_09050 [Phaeocystidibacter marisrubri]